MKSFPQSRFVDVAGLKTHLIAGGRGDRSILFLHGFPDVCWKWVPYMEHFAETHRVLAPDLWGYGDSAGGAPSTRSIAAIVERLRSFVLSEIGPSTTVMGHDWGGVLAWHLAGTHPALVERLVIVNAPFPNIYARLLETDATQQRSARYVQKICAAGGIDACFANDFAFLKYGMFEDRVGLSQELKDRLLTSWERPGAIAEMLELYKQNFGNEGFPKIAASVTTPTLLVWGMKDHALVPANISDVASFVPHLELMKVEEGDHWTDTTHRDEICRRMRPFLDGQ